MSRRRLDPAGREALARLVAEEGLPPAQAAARFGVSAATARRWGARWDAAGPDARRSGRWMEPATPAATPRGAGGSPAPGGAALALAEASIREAEALLSSIAPPARRPPQARAPRPRPVRAPVPATRRISARVQAIRWTRRQLAGVGLTLAFVPVGWVTSAAVLGNEALPGPSRPQAAGVPAPVFSPAAARAARGSATTLAAHARRRSIRVHRRPVAGDPTRLGARRFEGRRLPLVFLVERRRGRWLKVRLPVRPNGATGWVRRGDVRLRANPYRLRVLLGPKRIEVWRGERLLGRPRIAVGQAVSPTPTGRYFVTDLIRARDPDGLYGPYAFGLSAFSPVHTQFRGGPGQIGIHGTDRPDLLGSDVSAGCIRVGNRTVTRLARILPLGTPVEIRS